MLQGTAELRTWTGDICEFKFYFILILILHAFLIKQLTPQCSHT